MKKKSNPRRNTSRPGAALLLVLGMIVLLSFLTLGILQNAKREILWQSEGRARPELRIAAQSALESTIAVLSNFMRIDGAIYAPRQGWQTPLELCDWTSSVDGNAWKFDDRTTVSVKFTDESGKYSLTGMNTAMLSKLFESLGLSQSESSTAADRLLDWTDADDLTRPDGAETAEYESDGRNVLPPNCALRDFEEMRDILGFEKLFFDRNGKPSEVMLKFREAVSPLATLGMPNINTANAAVLSALCYDTDADPGTILDYLNDGNIFRNSRDLSRCGASALAGRVSFSARSLRVTITAKRGKASLVLDTLLEIGRGRSVPRILSQSEDDPL